MALVGIAQARAEPIPVYAEMSSINPVILFPAALAARGPEIARAFVASLTLGAGQFCTNPGLIVAQDGADLDAFLAEAQRAIAEAPAQTMLTPGICRAYADAVDAVSGHPAVKSLMQGRAAAIGEGQAHLLEASGVAWLADQTLQAEIFGACALVVRCSDAKEVAAVLENLEGQLTIALHIDGSDYADARASLPLLERKAGRLLVNGFGTGVEVSHAMVHGGPFPATSDARTTSVGSLAITRFLRPICYQDMPPELMPDALRDDNPFGLDRLLDGKRMGR